MIDENISLEEAQAMFAKDQFATMAGCSIVEAGKGHAVCEMPLSELHLNANGGIMGGAIFTLADFALAVASNIGQASTVAVENSIQFISAPKGSKLIATATASKMGRTLGFFTIEVKDDTDRLVAIMSATGCRV